MDKGKGKRLLRMAEELIKVDRNVPSKVTDFLEETLVILRAGEVLDSDDQEKVERFYKKYVGEEDVADEDEEKPDDEDADPDPDDFV